MPKLALSKPISSAHPLVDTQYIIYRHESAWIRFQFSSLSGVQLNKNPK